FCKLQRGLATDVREIGKLSQGLVEIRPRQFTYDDADHFSRAQFAQRAHQFQLDATRSSRAHHFDAEVVRGHGALEQAASLPINKGRGIALLCTRNEAASSQSLVQI